MEWKTWATDEDIYEFDIFSTKMIVISLVLTTLFFLATGPSFRWIAVFAIIILASLLFIDLISGSTKTLKEWRGGNELDEVINRPMSETSELVERAKNGRKWSRAILERKIRGTLMRRIAQREAISISEVRRMIEEPDELEEVVDDEVLIDYLVESKRFEDLLGEDETEKINRMAKREYGAYIKDVLDRMEGLDVEK